MRPTCVEPTWVKFGKFHDFAFVGKETIATASGVYAYFFDLGSGEKRIERFEGAERGDGASCMAGHSVVPIFSVVERKPCPNITVFTYPGIRKVSRCETNADSASGYLSCAFAGTDYLLSLTSFPYFRLIVWHWRTGERASAINTAIQDVNVQTIACSPSSPHLIGQFAPKTGRLSIYRLLVCSKIVRLLPVDGSQSERKIVSFSWSTDGQLFVADELWDVWSINLDGADCRVASGSECRSKFSDRGPVILAYREGLLVAEIPIGCGNANVVKFYRKSADGQNEEWRSTWTISLPSPPARLALHPLAEGFLIQGEDGEIFEATAPSAEQAPRLQHLLSGGIEYLVLCPTVFHGRYLVALDKSDRLAVLDASAGKLASSRLRINHHGNVSCAISHPVLPLVATCGDSGNCLLVDVSTPAAPRVRSCFHLQSEALDGMKFSASGRILGVAAIKGGRIFLLDEYVTKVLSFLKVDVEIVDFLIYDQKNAEEQSKILVLSTASAGSTIHVYSCNVGQYSSDGPDSTIELSSLFKRLFYAGENSFQILGIPFLSKQLHRFEIRNNFEDLILLEALPSLHRTRNIEIVLSQRWLITCGYDGLIVLRDASEPRKVLALFATHHRTEAGVVAAVVVGQTLVSLGRNGDLVANKLPFDPAPSSASDLSSALPSGPPPEVETVQETGETWLDEMVKSRLRADKKLALSARLSICKDLESLRIRVAELLDANEKEAPDARLPISTYDLDKERRERKMRAAEAEREETRRHLEDRIDRQNHAASYLREKFWNPLTVPPSSIVSISGNFEVANYPLTKISSEEGDVQSWAQFSLETRDLVARSEAKSPEPEGSDAAWTIENAAAQFDPPIGGFLEILETNSVSEKRERDWKVRFNELFDEACAAKRNEVKRIMDRIERLRYCARELEEIRVANHVISEGADDPLRADVVEHLVNVGGEELSIKELQVLCEREQPPIPEPSQSDRSPMNGEQRETHFTQTALDRMMDGVLEIRWEDDIKRDIPVPEPLLKKDRPKQTGKDEKKTRESDAERKQDEKMEKEAVEAYKERLRKVEIERRKYKSMLEAETVSTRDDLRTGVTAFEDRLRDLAKEKIRVDRSVLQQKLRRIQKIVGHRRIVQTKEKIGRKIERELAPATREARRLADDCTSLETAMTELRNRYENLCKREKTLEGKFRQEFSELKQPMVEHLFRHYKRRPRVVRGGCASLIFLGEVGKCIINKETSEILPSEWTNFLKAMDSLDVMPDGLPAQIELAHWQSMCRLRRIKVEMETKVKSCAIELAEAEQTLTFYRKASQAARTRASRCKEEVQNLERSLTDLTVDAEVGLPVKMGQVEVDLQGRSFECEEAVLIPRDELVRVNRAIAKFGEQKLAVLRQSIELRKLICMKEWRHARMKMKIRNLQEDLEDIRGVKITRLIREFASRCTADETLSEKELELPRWNREHEAVDDAVTQGEWRARQRIIARDLRKWRKRNAILIQEIEKRTSEKESSVAEIQEPSRLKDADFHRWNMAAITRKCSLSRQIRLNFEDLLALRSRLELFKLRTYPTLKFKL